MTHRNRWFTYYQWWFSMAMLNNHIWEVYHIFVWCSRSGEPLWKTTCSLNSARMRKVVSQCVTHTEQGRKSTPSCKQSEVSILNSDHTKFSWGNIPTLQHAAGGWFQPSPQKSINRNRSWFHKEEHISIYPCMIWRRSLYTLKTVGTPHFQWPFQEPKLEVPTIYKAYVRPI